MKVTILLNLGSPKSPSPEDVGTYLNEFLMDKRVIDLPFPLRWFLVKKMIVPKRKFSSAKLYQTIYKNGTFPLIEISKKQAQALEKIRKSPVEFAMRYGEPSLTNVFRKVQEKYPEARVSLVPMYPHYTQSSYETAVVYAKQCAKKTGFVQPIDVMKPYYDHPKYISCVASKLKKALEFTPVDHVLFSYHGIPVRHLKNSGHGTCKTNHCFPKEDGLCDVACSTESPNSKCYKNHIEITTSLVVEKLGISAYSNAYQSRLGKSPWLRPSTSETIANLAKKGVKRLAVVSPGFIVDCLETIEELGPEAETEFKENGGQAYTRVSCLNDDPDWMQALHDMINDDTNFFPLFGPDQFV